MMQVIVEAEMLAIWPFMGPCHIIESCNLCIVTSEWMLNS